MRAASDTAIVACARAGERWLGRGAGPPPDPTRSVVGAEIEVDVIVFNPVDATPRSVIRRAGSSSATRESAQRPRDGVEDWLAARATDEAAAPSAASATRESVSWALARDVVAERFERIAATSVANEESAVAGADAVAGSDDGCRERDCDRDRVCEGDRE